MICKYCKKEIESDSVFCRFCGERVQRAKRKPKEEVKVAPPTVTASGKYRGRVMVNGERVWITEDTEAAFYIRARAVKAGMIEQAKALPRDTLGDLIDRYLADNAAVLSPSTVQSYTERRHHPLAADDLRGNGALRGEDVGKPLEAGHRRHAICEDAASERDAAEEGPQRAGLPGL